MSWLRSIIERYDSSIWIRVIGTVMTTFATFMLRPFLGFYLYDKMDGNLVVAALIVGLQPLTGMISGIYSGSLSDRYGRKPLMVTALLIESISMLGFVWAESIYTFAILTVIMGIGGSLFWPAASAQVTDVVPEEKRSEVFALLHTALNVGAAFGPLIGVALYKINPAIVFAICSTALFLYCLLIVWKIPETLPAELRKQTNQPVHAKKNPQPRLRLREHSLLFLITLAAIPVTLLYSQVEVILPQQLRTRYDDFLNVFATLITINGILVVCCQLMIAKFAERFPTQKVILTAYLFLACVGFGYGWAPTFLLLIVAETLFTIGEMLYGPQIQKAVSIMAPTEFRARYFSIFGANWALTGAFGPMLGAFAFSHIGGSYWFSIIGAILLIAGMFQFRLVSRAMKSSQENQTEAALQIS